MTPTIRQIVTWKTISAVSRWSGVARTHLTLLTILSELRDNATEQLRAANNDALVGELGFPVGVDDWDSVNKDLKTVENLRDHNLKRVTDATII